MTTLVAVFGLIGGIGGLGGLSALFYVTSTKRRLNAEARKIGVDADDVISGRALEMYDRVRNEAAEAKAEARACRAKVDALSDHVDHLNRIMRDAGLEPPVFHWPSLEIVDGSS